MSRDLAHDVFETLAAVYALGALDGEDRLRFEAHLAAGCARCEATLRESEAALARLATAEPPVTPPAEVRQALLRRLAATAPPTMTAAQRSRRWIPWAMATAAMVLLGAGFAAAVVAARYEARLGQMAREMSAVRERLEREERTLREEVGVYRSVAELLRDPASRVVTLRGTGPAPAAVGRVVWNETRGGRLLVANLPPAPPGKAYELWTIAGGTPRPAGVFTTDAAGRASHAIAPGAESKPVDVFAVTIEPERGVPVPTGPIVLASK